MNIEQEDKTDEQKYIDSYIAETQAKIDDLIEECRAKERQVDGFGFQFLEQILLENKGIPDSVIEGIKKCIANPDATCVLKMDAPKKEDL